MAVEDLIETIWTPELERIKTETGSEIIPDLDESSVQVRLVHQGKTWFKYKLRDRRFDGTPVWKQTRLVDWSYDGEKDKFPFSAVEESVYCLDPRYPLTDTFPPEIAEFITNPFSALPYEKPDKDSLLNWFHKCRTVMESESIVYPGYFTTHHIPGVRSNLHRTALRLVRASGYEWLTAVPTWWHTASICEHLGFNYYFSDDKLKILLIRQLLTDRFGEDESETSRRRSSWIVMIQFWADLLVKSGLRLDRSMEKYILRDEAGQIITFPLVPGRNLWMNHKT